MKTLSLNPSKLFPLLIVSVSLIGLSSCASNPDVDPVSEDIANEEAQPQYKRETKITKPGERKPAKILRQAGPEDTDMYDFNG